MRPTALAFAALALMAAAGPGWGKALEFKDDTTVTGECKRLIILGHVPNSECDDTVELVELRSERDAIGFRSQNGQMYWFLGPRKGVITPDENTIILPIDGLRVAGNRSGEDQKAIGSCRYGNPFLGSLRIVCHAETMDGTTDAEFVTDNKEPRYR